MATSPTKSFKKGARVNFTARKTSGVGKIKFVQEGLRGLWYGIEHELDKKIFKVRAAGLSLAA